MQKANYIKQRLSLREPQREALDIMVELGHTLELRKDQDLENALRQVQALVTPNGDPKYPGLTDFERDFPSFCFSLATGIGKTRLMGAAIAWLYLQKGIRNFFVLAPNLTIYEKLIEDLGNPGNPKYVFTGIAEFVHNRPVIITGDNYAQQGALFSASEIRINIFNIAKFNSDSKTTRKGGQKLAPRIKRLAEYLGQSYWEYLSNLQDLVVLMDEAHRYHADASSNAINELKPVLGLELTATPIDERGNVFRNIVYEYNLAQALAEGKYVKNPAIATRQNFNSRGKSQQEIEQIKLEDAVSLHEHTKAELAVYAQTTGAKEVKPFILVACRDTEHARQTYEYLSSSSFYGGRYQNKVLQVDSTTRNDEAIERQFVSLEDPANPIEIVIHVFMLKEGWDVNNLYTICPLNVANSLVLIEQTIGRGLRLPYGGQRTGVKAIDQLTVVAHENFEQVIARAQDPESIFSRVTYIELGEEELQEKVVPVSSPSRNELQLRQEAIAVSQITDPQQQQKAKNVLDAKRAILDVLPTFRAEEGVGTSADLSRPEIRAIALEKVAKHLNQGQLGVFNDQILEEAAEQYDAVVTNWRQNIIEIPRMDLVQTQQEAYFNDFDLDTNEGFSLQALDEAIMVQELAGERQVSHIGVAHGAFQHQSPQNQLIVELLNYPKVSYDDNAALLHKLATQATQAIQQNLERPEELNLVIRQYKNRIAQAIYQQLDRHFVLPPAQYQQPRVLPFVRIEDWSFNALESGAYKDYREVVKPDNTVKKYIYRGFTKACHFEYKFDSNTEKTMAGVLENDPQVMKWLRPAPSQFRIYWANNSKRYEPDFVAETEDAIYLIETKWKRGINDAEVLDKRRAATEYCRYATEFTSAHGGKPWRYLLIPHDEVRINNSLPYYIQTFSNAQPVQI